jgi:hypothetical protein
MPCSSRPVLVFKRVLPGSCGSAGNVWAPPRAVAKHANFTACWLLPTHYPLRNPRLTIFEHLLAGLGRRLVSTWTRLRNDLKVAKRHCCVDGYRTCKIHSDRPRPTGMAPSGVSSCHVDPAANPANRDDLATLPVGFWHDRSGMNEPMAALGGPGGGSRGPAMLVAVGTCMSQPPKSRAKYAPEISSDPVTSVTGVGISRLVLCPPCN